MCSQGYFHLSLFQGHQAAGHSPLRTPRLAVARSFNLCRQPRMTYLYCERVNPLKVRSRQKFPALAFPAFVASSSVEPPPRSELTVCAWVVSYRCFVQSPIWLEDAPRAFARTGAALVRVRTQKTLSTGSVSIGETHSSLARPIGSGRPPSLARAAGKQTILALGERSAATAPISPMVTSHPFTGWRPPPLLAPNILARRSPRRRAADNRRLWPACRPAP